MTTRRDVSDEPPMSTPISTTDAIPVKAETIPEQPPTAEVPRSGSPSKAELEAAVAELKAALADARQAAHERETALQEKITTLQSSVQEQRSLIEKLQTDLEQSQQIKAELETAKTVILKLSHLNTQAIAIPAPTTAPPAPVAPPAAERPPEPPAPLVPQREQRDRRDLTRDLWRDSRPVSPRLPVEPPTVEQKESKISEIEIGWMD